MNVRNSLAVGITAILLALPMARAGDAGRVVYKVFDNTALATGASNLSAAIDLTGLDPEMAAFSLQLSVTNYITNSGAVTASYELSNDGVSWPLRSNIVAGLATTNNPGGGGTGLYPFSPALSKFMRFKILVTGTNADVTGIAVIQ